MRSMQVRVGRFLIALCLLELVTEVFDFLDIVCQQRRVELSIKVEREEPHKSRNPNKQLECSLVHLVGKLTAVRHG